MKAYSPAKDGRDAGDLAGIAPIGVRATSTTAQGSPRSGPLSGIAVPKVSLPKVTVPDLALPNRVIDNLLGNVPMLNSRGATSGVSNPLGGLP